MVPDSELSGTVAAPALGDDCRSERLALTLASLLPALAAIALGLWLYLCLDVTNSTLIAFNACFTALLLVTALLETRSPAIASVVLVAGLSICGLTAGDVLRYPTAIAVPLLVPVLTGLLFGATYALPAGFLLAAALVPGLPTGAGDMLTAITVLVAGILTWSGLRPSQEMLEIAYRGSLDARGLVERLRDNQGKLNRTIRALDTAYRLLESTNRALAEARTEAEHLRELKSRFAAGLSHELRTPLNIILGFSEIMYRNPGLYGVGRWNDSLRRDLAQVQRNAGYLSVLLDDILDLARLDANAMPIRREYTDLRAVLEQAVRGVASLAEDKGIEVECEWDTRIPLVYLDETRIRQVLYNLLSNSIRVTFRGRVVVSARRDEDRAVVTVSDDGPGIPPDALEMIFDEYQVLDASSAQGERGKGLGLAIARQLVRLHGGNIWASNQPQGGAELSFSLPLDGSHRASQRLITARPLPIPQIREKPRLAMLAHSESALAYLHRRMEPYELTPVLDVADLIRRWQEVRPIALVETVAPGESFSAPDLNLPEPIPHIRLSIPGPHKALDRVGFAGLLAKPVSPKSLLSELERVMGENECRRLLIVDDDRGFVQLLHRMLQDADVRYEVLTAYNGRDAVRLARREHPDVILLDMAMPGMTGLEVLEVLRADSDTQNIPVIAVTGAVSTDDEDLPAEFAVWSRREFSENYLLGLLNAALTRSGAEETRQPEPATTEPG